MPRLPSSQPTEVELQILRILWELGPSTARQIHDRLVEDRGTNYSTTVKMLSIMLEKELGQAGRDGSATGLPARYDAASDPAADAHGSGPKGLRRFGRESGPPGARFAEVVARRVG